MRRIAKMDYYAGAFITTLLKSSKGAPAIINETNDSRRVEFETDLGKFNIYIKYSGSPRISTVRGRKKISWYVNFSDMDVYKLENEFVDRQDIRYVVLVLSNRALTKTRVAVIACDDIMKCLNKETPGGSRGINIVRYGRDHNFTCYGATEAEEDGFAVPINYAGHFDKREIEDGIP